MSPENLSGSGSKHRTLLPIPDDEKEISTQASVLILTRTNNNAEKDANSSTDEETEECCTESAAQ